MESTTIAIIGIMISPLYAILLWQSKRIVKVERCITGIETALEMKFPDLKGIFRS